MTQNEQQDKRCPTCGRWGTGMWFSPGQMLLIMSVTFVVYRIMVRLFA